MQTRLATFSDQMGNIIGELNEEKQNDVTMAFIALIKNCGGGMK